MTAMPSQCRPLAAAPPRTRFTLLCIDAYMRVYLHMCRAGPTDTHTTHELCSLHLGTSLSLQSPVGAVCPETLDMPPQWRV